MFSATVVDLIDGDSIIVEKDDGTLVEVRIGGVDVPSRGKNASRAKEHIRTWFGRRVSVKRGCCGKPHGETPGIVTDAAGHNIGRELLSFGTRLPQFPIDATLPSMAHLRMRALDDE